MGLYIAISSGRGMILIQRGSKFVNAPVRRCEKLNLGFARRGRSRPKKAWGGGGY